MFARLTFALVGLAGGARLCEAQTPPPEEGVFTIEEIKVTARRVQENLQDTPVSVTVVTPESLEQKQIFRTDDLDQTTPNMVFDSSARLAGNGSAVVITIRGIGQTDPTPDVDPGVGLYIDDVYMGHGVGGSLDFRDIASVQVLRGPQGALFGRNTIGGAVLITTQDPGKQLGANVKVSLGSDKLRDVFAGVDLPISDTLGARVTFGKRKQDGYIAYPALHTSIGDTNTYTATGKLLWDPGEHFEARLLLDFTTADENGAALTNVAINPTSAFPRTVSYAAGCPGMLPPPNPNAPSPSPVPQINDPRCANNFLLGGPYEYDFRTPNIKWLPVQLYEHTFSKTTFSGSTSYRWTPQIMTYLSYSQGFKGGGWNSHFNRAIQPTDPHLFKEETADSYELGFKTDLFGKRLRLNGAVFTTDYKNMQFTYRIGVAPFLFNTGKATIDGGELELTWVPTDAWLIEGGVGRLHGKIDRVDPLVNAVTAVSTQNKLPFTPDWQANAGIAYKLHLGTGSLTPRADVFYQSRTFFDEGNTVQIAQMDPITLLGASLAYEAPTHVWHLIAGGRDITDKKYSQGGNPSYTTSSGYAEASYVRGREYYVSFAYDFNGGR